MFIFILILTYFSLVYTCMCLYLYIHNKYTPYTHTRIACKQTFVLNMIND